MDQDFVQRNPPVVEVKFEVGELVSTTQVIRFGKHTNLPWGYVTQQGQHPMFHSGFPRSITVSSQHRSCMERCPAIDKEQLTRGASGTFIPVIHGLPPFWRDHRDRLSKKLSASSCQLRFK